MRAFYECAILEGDSPVGRGAFGACTELRESEFCCTALSRERARVEIIRAALPFAKRGTESRAIRKTIEINSAR